MATSAKRSWSLNVISALVVALFFCASVQSGEPTIDVTFYFSKKDPHLAAADKALDEALKQLPQIRIIRVCIDTADGYKQLAEEEKRLEIKDPGEMTMVFGPIFLTSKGEKRYIEQCFAGAMKRLIGQMKGDRSFKEPLPADFAAYVKEIFGPGSTAKPVPTDPESPIVYHRVSRDGKNVGWAVSAYHAIGCPICSDTQFLLAADEKKTVLDVRPVREIERWGAKLPDAETAKFTAQFKSKSPADAPLKIDALSAATKTTFAYQSAINEILEELKKR